MYFTLSWRNLWRNKKRTVIAAASVFFAVLLAVMMRSAQLGTYEYMIHSAARIFTGHLQLQEKDYWEKRSLDNSFTISEEEMQQVAALPHVSTVSPRLESFALISRGRVTKVGEVVGIVPRLEARQSDLDKKVVSGSYLQEDQRAVLLGKGLAEMLKAGVGDSVVLYGQGYHGQIAAARLPVAGIIELPFPDLNNMMVYMPLQAARDVFLTGNRLTSLALLLDSNARLAEVARHLKAHFGEKFAVMTWEEMMPELKQSIQLDNVSGQVMLAILYIVIAFGVFGTIMMMTTERTREFGVLVSVGMKKWRLMVVTTLETICLSFLGAITGALLSFPMVWYLSRHPLHFSGEAARAYEAFGVEPIFVFTTDPTIILNQALVVLVIALATASYPILFVNKLDPAKALHG